jgi:DNA invertase Pin-like site-specific DNA recombinase
MFNESPPLTPRRGNILKVLVGCRISGCQDQKEVSLRDQEDHAREVIEERYSGLAEYKVIATVGKGEALDRPELAEFERDLRSGEFDVFVLEDIGRLVRGAGVMMLIGIGRDYGVRTLSPHDGLDTDDPNWEDVAIGAARAHLAHNAHASKRIKQKAMNRFQKEGGCPGRPPAGFIVPPGIKTYGGWTKDDTYTPIFQKVCRMRTAGESDTSVASWLNLLNIPVGRYCRNKRWDPKMVKRLFSNKLLKGIASRGKMVSVKIHETGRRVPKKNPKGPKYFAVPHLAHLTPEEFDTMQDRVHARNAHLRRKPEQGNHPSKGVSKRASKFPGLATKCFYCGHLNVWGGNGKTTDLMCSGSRKACCWSSCGFDGPMLRRAVIATISNKLMELRGFESQFKSIVDAADYKVPTSHHDQMAGVERDLQEVARKKTNVINAISEMGSIPDLKVQLENLLTHETDLQCWRRDLVRAADSKCSLPGSLAALQAEWVQAWESLGEESPVFAELLRRMVPEIHVYFVRMIDGPNFLARARVVFDLLGDYPDAAKMPELASLSKFTKTIDLFVPAQRERIRKESVALRKTGMKLKEIAAAIAEKPTDTAVGNALRIQAMMDAQGLTTPYILITSPPPENKQLCRYRCADYRFTPVEGYVPPNLT